LRRIAEALRLYTLGGACFTFDDDKRRSLGAGKLADLAMLSKDYLTVPTDDIGSTASLLTMVGGAHRLRRRPVWPIRGEIAA
jgi:predicted amidohydrolase YtcJ